MITRVVTGRGVTRGIAMIDETRHFDVRRRARILHGDVDDTAGVGRRQNAQLRRRHHRHRQRRRDAEEHLSVGGEARPRDDHLVGPAVVALVRRDGVDDRRRRSHGINPIEDPVGISDVKLAGEILAEGLEAARLDRQKLRRPRVAVEKRSRDLARAVIAVDVASVERRNPEAAVHGSHRSRNSGRRRGRIRGSAESARASRRPACPPDNSRRCPCSACLPSSSSRSSRRRRSPLAESRSLRSVPARRLR